MMSGRMSFDDGLGADLAASSGNDDAFAIGTENDEERPEQDLVDRSEAYDDPKAVFSAEAAAKKAKAEADELAKKNGTAGEGDEGVDKGAGKTKKKVYDENGQLVVEGEGEDGEGGDGEGGDGEGGEQTGAAAVLGVEQLDNGLKAASNLLSWGFARARAASEQVATAVAESEVGKSVIEAAEKAKESETYKAAASAATAVAERTSEAASAVNARAKEAAEAAAPHIEAARERMSETSASIATTFDEKVKPALQETGQRVATAAADSAAYVQKSAEEAKIMETVGLWLNWVKWVGAAVRRGGGSC